MEIALKTSGTIVYVVVAAAFTFIYFLFANPEPADVFWGRFAWIHFQILLLWIVNVFSLFVLIDDRPSLFGLAQIAPGAGIATFGYAALSILAMVIGCVIGGSHLASKIQLSVQIVLFVTFLILFFLLFFNLAATRAGQLREAASIRADLSAEAEALLAIERTLADCAAAGGDGWRTIADRVRAVRETVAFATPKAGRAGAGVSTLVSDIRTAAAEVRRSLHTEFEKAAAAPSVRLTNAVERLHRIARGRSS